MIINLVNDRKTPIIEQLNQDSAQVNAQKKVNTQSPMPRKKASLWWRLFKGLMRIFLLILCLITLCFAGLYWIVGTNTGTRFALNQAQKYSQGMFAYREVKGNFLDPLTLTGVKIELPHQAIKIDQLVLDWDYFSLFNKKLQIETISLNGLSAVLQTAAIEATEPDETTAFNFKPISFKGIQLPLAIQVNALTLEKSNIWLNDQHLLENGNLKLAVLLNNERWEISQLSMDGLLRHVLQNSSAKTVQETAEGIAPESTSTLVFPLSIKGQLVVEPQKDHIALRLHPALMDFQWEKKSLSVDSTVEINGILNDLLANMTMQLIADDFGIQPVFLDLDSQITAQDHIKAALSLKNQQASLVTHLEWQLSTPTQIVAQVTTRIPSFKTFLPFLSGRLNMDVDIKGQLTSPELKAVVVADNLQFQRFRLKALRLNAMMDSQRHTDIDLMVAELFQGQPLLWKGDIKLKGDANAHRLQVNVNAPHGKAWLVAQGRATLDTATPIWNGLIEQLRLSPRHLGTFTLQKPTQLMLSINEQNLEKLCLTQNIFGLCLEGKRLNNEVNANLQFTQLGLNLFSGITLPTGLDINSMLNGKANLSFKSLENFNIEADVNATPGQVQYLFQGNMFTVPLRSTVLTFKARPQNAQVNLNLDWGNILALTAALDVTDPLNRRELNGQIRFNIPELNWLGTFSPQLRTLQADISSEIQIAGTASAPRLSGYIAAEKGDIFIAEVNQRIRNIALRAQLNPATNALDLSGSLQAGEGSLQLSGTFDLLRQILTLNANGEQLQIADSDEIKIWISPKITFIQNAEQMRLQGEMIIPKANINVGMGSSDRPVVARSNDVQIKRRNETNSSSAFDRLGMDFQVNLGDQVRVGNRSLQAQLIGGLRLLKEPRQPLRGNGSIQVARGEYEIYGQKLNIDRGRILFSGGLLTNPGLDLQASRQFTQPSGNVNVGVQISGALNRPKLTLFSRPSLPDTHIVSYLILGRAPDARSGGETLMLLNAVRKIALNQTDEPLDDFSKQIGLDELGLNQDSQGNPTLGIGKYITDKLYVGYGLGLVSDASFFRLRYRFKPWLSFEAQSSETSSGGDLLYSRESKD